MGGSDSVESVPVDRVATRERLLLGLALLAATALVVLGVVPLSPRATVLAALAAASGAAFLCGSLGLGFGAFLVPALILLDIDARVAVASSLAAQLVVVPVGGASHASLGHVRLGIVGPLVAAGVLGAVVGAQFSTSIDRILLAVLIAASTIFMGALVLARGSVEMGSDADVAERTHPGALIGIGLVAGFAAAAFGTGWGPVGVSLLLLAGVVPRLAIGSSVTARAPIALSATLAYLVLAGPQQIVPPDILVPVVAGGVFGVLAGSLVTRRLPNGRLRTAVGAAIVVLGFLVLAKVG